MIIPTLLYMLFGGTILFFFLLSITYKILPKDKDDTVHTTRMEFDKQGHHIRTQQKGYRKFRFKGKKL